MKPVAIQYSDTLSYLSLIVRLSLPFISSYSGASLLTILFPRTCPRKLDCSRVSYCYVFKNFVFNFLFSLPFFMRGHENAI